ncbi:MAG: hypothetical protein ABI601_21485, partial [bacterium]
AADMAESATTDDRVEDRLGGWQDSETRKQIYQDRRTDELRVQASRVRRELRLGATALRSEASATNGSPADDRSGCAVDGALTRAARGVDDENQRPNGSPNGSQEKIAGTHSDRGDGK